MRLLALLALAFALAACSREDKAEPGCVGHGGVVRMKVDDGVAYYTCRDGAVGRF